MNDIIHIAPDIRLTPFQPEDKAKLVSYLNDEAVARNTLTIPYPYTEKDADEWLKLVKKRREDLGFETNWAIRHQTDGLIGGIGVFAREGFDAHLDELGYWIAAHYRGRGIATAAVRGLAEFLFRQRPKLQRLQAFIFPDNPASGRVLEKAGFIREGYHPKLYNKKGTLKDGISYGRLRE